MLYTSFVFTKVGKKALKRLQDKLDLKVSTTDFIGDDYFEFGGEFTDEEIYNLCCAVTECVVSEVICSTVKTALFKTIGEFNSDEFMYISDIINNAEFVKEIPGRMYVYLKMNHSVNPIGFYMFMCRDIDAGVCQRTVDEANRILEINERTDMIQTLKYFSDMSPESVNRVVIFADSGRIEIKECIPPRENIFTEYSSSETDVLAELVSLNPESIEIHGKEEFFKNEISSLIEAVFENRIEYR